MDEFGQLRDMQRDLIEAEKRSGEEMFLGRPDRWYADPHWRCTRGHVSRHFIKSEDRGDQCPECLAPVVITFPEDVDDPRPP